MTCPPKTGPGLKRDLLTPGQSYGYDANGNLTSKTDATGSWTYAWDYENRLKQAVQNGGVTVNYSYDALGRRIQRNDSNGATIKFVYDGADVVRDLNTDLSTAADYLNGPGIDNKVRQTVAGTISYFIQDHLGTTLGFTDASGSVSSSLVYDSFGNLTSGSASTRYTYTAREIDSGTGLIYYRARWYDPQVGRFVQEDPLGLAEGINFYSYVKNDPIRFMDPEGLARCNRLLGALGGALLGAGAGGVIGEGAMALAGGAVGTATARTRNRFGTLGRRCRRCSSLGNNGGCWRRGWNRVGLMI
jgi:RHS repeat-associated protein